MKANYSFWLLIFPYTINGGLCQLHLPHRLEREAIDYLNFGFAFISEVQTHIFAH